MDKAIAETKEERRNSLKKQELMPINLAPN